MNKTNDINYFQILANLKSDFDAGKQIQMKDKYLIVVSLPSIHNHSIEASLLNLSIDKSVRDEISRLVNNGFSNVKIIQSMLKDFVEQSCSSIPSNLSRAFYPNERTIKHFITKFTNEKHQIKIDQNDLQIKITQWEISRPKDNFYLQLFNKENGITKLFLFCQQTEWQRYLLNRYGNVCFLDATYKTTNDVPLFFLIVKTNVNYCVAASFFVQCKDSKSIEEALNIIKSWNTTWSPQYFLTDYCEAEYKAITKVFNCPSYICDFYREQAWLRWTNKQGNLYNKEYQAELLALWKNIANSSDDDEFTNKVESMKLTEAWLKNPKAQEYFIETWLPIKEKWTDKFFKLEYDIKVTTNNGVESQNKLIKQFYLDLLNDKSLNSILENIVEQFLPQTLYKYQKKNFKLTAHHNQISNTLPIFLHGRPKTFVKHVHGRYAIAQNIHNKNKIKKLQLEHQFEIQDKNGSNLYVVDFQKPSCTCLDFKKYHWPCIHLCELFIHVPGYTFNNLPDKYKNSVYISPDLQYSKNFKDEKTIVTSPILQSRTKTNYFNPHENTSTENVENRNITILIQCREIVKKITDLTYLIDQKEYSTDLTKQLEVLNNVHNKMSSMVNKKDELNLLPTKRSLSKLTDLSKKKKND